MLLDHRHQTLAWLKTKYRIRKETRELKYTVIIQPNKKNTHTAATAEVGAGGGTGTGEGTRTGAGEGTTGAGEGTRTGAGL